MTVQHSLHLPHLGHQLYRQHHELAVGSLGQGGCPSFSLSVQQWKDLMFVLFHASKAQTAAFAWFSCR